MLTLADSHKRLVTAMTATGYAVIRDGGVWTAGTRHYVRDLYALRAARLVSSAEPNRSNWAAQRWHLNERGRAVAQELIEQAASTGRDMPTPGPPERQT